MSDLHIDPNAAQAAYARLLPRLQTLKASEVVIPSVEVTKAVMVALATHRALAPELDAMSAVLKDFKRESLAELDVLALAAWQAVIEERNENDPAHFLAEVLPEALKLKSDLLTAATALAARGRLPTTVVEGYAAGTGHEDLANDLAGLAQLFQSRWSDLANRTDISEAELERAKSLGATILARLALRRVVLSDPRRHPLSASELRRRAFSLLFTAYEEVRRAAAATYWYSPGGWERFAPSLWSGQGRGGAARRETDPARQANPVVPSGGEKPRG